MKKLDLVGQQFGKWTVVAKDEDVLKQGRSYWLCHCECGTERKVVGTSLTAGISTSCGCSSHTNRLLIDPSDYIGKKFTRLLVISVAEPIIDQDGKQRSAYNCKCDCGKELIVKRHDLQNTRGPKSCGCLLIEQRSMLGLSKRQYEPNMATAKIIFDFRYADGNISFDDFLTLSQKNCYYCGTAPNTTYNKFSHRGKAKTSQYAVDNGNFTYNGLDRINSDLPHNLDNVVPCCIMCNTAKSNHDQKAWGEWICRVYNNWAHNFIK